MFHRLLVLYMVVTGFLTDGLDVNMFVDELVVELDTKTVIRFFANPETILTKEKSRKLVFKTSFAKLIRKPFFFDIHPPTLFICAC